MLSPYIKQWKRSQRRELREWLTIYSILKTVPIRKLYITYYLIPQYLYTERKEAGKALSHWLELLVRLIRLNSCLKLLTSDQLISSYITKKVQLEILTEINLTESKLIKEINLTKSKLIKEKRSKRYQFGNYNITISNLTDFIDLILLFI